MEDAILTKRRHYLEELLQREPMNYDLWFDYARMEEMAAVG